MGENIEMKVENSTISQEQTKRRPPRVALFGGIAAAVIAVTAIICLILGVFTDDRIHLSGATEELLNTLGSDVEILVICEEGSLDMRVSMLLKQYAQLSDRITVSFADPAETPEVLTAYDCDTDTVIVSCPETGKMRAIPIKSNTGGAMIMYSLDYATYTYEETVYNGEQALSAAVDYVARQYCTAYVLDGHGEFKPDQQTISVLADCNARLADESVYLQNGVPEDCELLFCWGPCYDLTDGELSVLKDYLAGGGNFLLLISECDHQNFNLLLSDYGLEMQNGYVGDMSEYYYQMYNAYGYFCIAPQLSDENNITSSVQRDAIMLYLAGLLVGEPARDSICVSPFLTTSDSGFLHDGTNLTEGRYILAAEATEEIDPRVDADGQACLIVYSSTYFIGEAMDEIDMANYEIFRNSVAAMTGCDATVYSDDLGATLD